MQKHKHLLTSKLFIIGLLILIINDHVLKYTYPNILTGKLSDFSGLFIFPIFFSAFWYGKRRLIYILTDLIFIFWKSSFSQELIDTWNGFGVIGVSRVVDYYDLFALTILPLSLKYIESLKTSKNSFTLKPTLIGGLSIIAFCATSLPRQSFKPTIDSDKVYILNMSKTEFFEKVQPGYGFSDTIQKNMDDSLFYCHYDIQNVPSDLTAIIILKQISDSTISIELDSIHEYAITGKLFKGIKQKHIDYMESLKLEDFEADFEENFIKVLTGENKAKYPIHFDNKELVDKMMEEYRKTVGNTQ
jgi:hypothetical protein